MRNIILNLAISLDSYIEGPNGEYDWCLTDQDYGFTEFFSGVDAIFYGRKSFELFGNNYNPPADAPDMEKNIFEMMSGLKQYVFSTTLKSVEGAELISSDFEEKVKKIKEQRGKDIYLFGGAGLITSFVNADLVDEYIIGVHPIILGAGKSLFMNIKERKILKLISTKAYSSGLVMLRYKADKKD